MKPILFLLIIASLTLAQNPSLQKGRQVLQDFRPNENTADLKIPAATQRTVLSKMFRRYLSDQSKCSADFDARGASDYLAAARKAGQITPSFNDMATGSFTAAGQTQTLYVISVNECNASHADNYGTKRVAIFAGQQLIADVDVDFKSGIARKTDLNSDGIDELLMTSGDMAQGNLTEMAVLVSFQNGRFRVLHDFGTVVEDSCATAMPGSSSDAAVLYISDVVPGNMPKLTMDNYTAACRKNKRWKLVSSGKSRGN
jgi:hypothetical protein